MLLRNEICPTICVVNTRLQMKYSLYRLKIKNQKSFSYIFVNTLIKYNSANCKTLTFCEYFTLKPPYFASKVAKKRVFERYCTFKFKSFQSCYYIFLFSWLDFSQSVNSHLNHHILVSIVLLSFSIHAKLFPRVSLDIPLKQALVLFVQGFI